MEKLLVLSGLMACLYFLIKILEMKYIDKEAKPLKYVIRDTFYVFISSLACLYLFLTFNGSIDNMMSGSVIFDMAVESGGNVEGSEVDKVVDRNGVKIIGISNLASKVSSHASLALSNNYNNWIIDFFDSETSSINFDFEDEIIQSSVLVYDGKIKNERFQ